MESFDAELTALFQKTSERLQAFPGRKNTLSGLHTYVEDYWGPIFDDWTKEVNEVATSHTEIEREKKLEIVKTFTNKLVKTYGPGK